MSDNGMSIDTYDIEDVGKDYMQYRDMVKCEDSEWFKGDWVKTEDHEKEVKRLNEDVAFLLKLIAAESKRISFRFDSHDELERYAAINKKYHKAKDLIPTER